MSKHNASKTESRERRRARVRSKITGTAERPRLAVFRSNTQIAAQIIDDEKGLTITSFSSLKIKSKANKVEQAKQVGTNIARLAKEKGVTRVVFDRGGFLYHGRIKALAESARAEGLEF